MIKQYKPLSIYIHWPFCLKKCPYCDFNSHIRDTIDHKAWAKALTEELEFYKQKTGQREIVSIFFGGGTPSLMLPETIRACVDKVIELWQVSENVEVSMEANPTSSAGDKFKAFKEAGINRLSIGVQSLRQSDLSFLGREHSAREAVDVIKMAHSIFERTSFDLIYGRPKQTVDEWQEELTEALALEPSHISLYQLTIEQGTQFFTQHARGDFQMPSSDLEADFYDVTQDILENAGLPAYEVSNHAKPGQECLHNLAYWRYEDYIGVGPGAHGRFVGLDGQRIATRAHKAPEIWMDRVNNAGHGAHPFEKIAGEDAFSESLMMGLRLYSGVHVKDIESKSGICFNSKISQQKIDQMLGEGYLNYDGDILRSTDLGMKCLNSLLVYLLA